MKLAEIGSRQCWLILLAGVLVWSGAQAQEASQPKTVSANRILDTPLPSSLGKDSRAFSPARIFNNPTTGNYGYDLKEKPAPAGGDLKVSTTLETYVDHKTTNHIGGGGGPGWGGEAARKPPPAAQPHSPTFGFEFADFVRQSVGGNLSVFGADILGDASKSAPIDPMTVPADYRVGPGDELLIRAWGQIDIDFQGQVDRTGQIFLPKIGPITVAGLPVKDLAEHLKKSIGQQFKNFELTATLGHLRQIQFYVMGFAKQPGVHTANSTSTALYGLMAAGGAQAFGDLRRIELRRGGTTVATVDAYRFLIDGDRQSDPQLLPGDVLFVPPAKGFTAIAGRVKRAAIFHVADGMTVDDLLKAAGGFTLSGTGVPLRLERVVNGRRIVEHLSYSPSVGMRQVRDGDLYMVLPVSPRIENTVTLRGHVAQPLRSGWTEGMRVSDLLGSRDDLVRMANWAQRNERETLNKLSSPNRDNDFKRDFPDVEWDYAAIERIDPVTLTASIKTFSLAKAMAKDPAEDLRLQAGDTVVIFASSDFRQPQHKRFKTVRVEGEVKVPGIYPIEEGQNFLDALQRAGGLTNKAYVYGTVFTRASAKKTEAERMKEATDRIEQDYLRFLAGRSRSTTTQEEAMVGNTEFDAVRQLVGRLRAVQPQGRIPLNMAGELSSHNAYPAVELEDEDTIYVPLRPATVTVVGAVFQEGSQLWVKGATVGSAIDRAGGTRPYAENNGTVVIRADGTVRQVGGWWGGSTEINPGDTIVVPEDVQSPSWTKAFKDWSQIFYQLGLGTAALKILKSSL
jgi:protein involved in polysaccharide export with SLBB domain